MKFTFEVGETEKHTIQFKFNQMLGNLSILVDGENQLKDFRVMSLSLTKTYELEVGIEEKHSVKIEKVRKLLLAGFRKSKYKVYIDDLLAHQYEGR